MERAPGPQNPFEVYCYDCGVSFAAGTRRCVHCGGRLTAYGQAAPARESAFPLGARAESDGGLEGLEEEAEAGSALRRFGGLAIWALIAVSALISNLCRGGGG